MRSFLFEVEDNVATPIFFANGPSVVILTVRSRAEGGWIAAHKFHHPGAGSKGASGGLFRVPFPASQAGPSESSVESTTLVHLIFGQHRILAGTDGSSDD